MKHLSDLSWDEYFTRMAMTAALKSKDASTKVGAVIFRPDNTIAAVGFNGFPKRMKDDERYLRDPEYRDEKLKRIVHAEDNAIRLCRDHSTEGFGIAVSRHPCGPCALRILSTGITRVIYRSDPVFEQRWQEQLDDARRYFSEANIEFTALELD